MSVRRFYTEYAREMLADCLRPVLAKPEVLASELGMSVQNLRRMLYDEGTSWQRLLDEELTSRIRRMRGEGASREEIAEALGWARADSLTRFERRHRMKPPRPLWMPRGTKAPALALPDGRKAS